MTKSYRQFCAVARALDAAGDRWVLLVVRELLALGPSRYVDLKRGLPGIASNLLADRLRSMEADGLVERYEAPPPVAATLYRLTPRGRELRGVVEALARWGTDGMAAGPAPDEAVRPHWPALAGALLARGGAGGGAVVGIESGGESLRMVPGEDGFEIRRGTEPAADVTLTGPPVLVGAVLSGLLGTAEAEARGLCVAGSRSVLRELLP